MTGLENAIISTVPAAQELRRVKGFEPLKYLHKIISTDGKDVLRLDLSYKKLWFRLACPNGRMVLKPLQVTEQLAIYEAMVFQGKDEQEPIARITSTATRGDSPNGRYIEAAQDKALNEVLENAGFGIQYCDLIENAGRATQGSPVDMSHLRKESDSTADTGHTESAPEDEPTEDEPAIETAEPESIGKTDTVVQDVSSAATETVAETVPEAKASHTETPVTSLLEPTEEVPQPTAKGSKDDNANARPAEPSALEQLLAGTQQNVVPFPAKAAPAQRVAESTTDPMPANTADPPESSYTADMSAEEILSRMTLEEANSVVVTSGLCAGMTMEQIAKKRPANLRYYVFSDATSNILKAAARLVLDSLTLAKAG